MGCFTKEVVLRAESLWHRRHTAPPGSALTCLTPRAWQVMDGTLVGAQGPPGFASLRTLSVTPRLCLAGVSVFGTASKKDSLVLQLRAPGDDDAERLAAGPVAAKVLQRSKKMRIVILGFG
jgi:hypothetical protein